MTPTPKFLLSVRGGGKEKYPLILASKGSCLCRFSPWRTCTLVLAMEEMVDITGATCRTWVSIKVPYSFCFQLITGAALHNSVTSSFPFISFDSICKRYSGYFPIFCILMWRCILSNRQRHCSNLNVIPVFMWEISCVVGLPLLMNILQCSDVVAVSLLENHSHRGSF